MNPFTRRALEYVRNTNGGALFEDFVEHHAPIGPTLWWSLRGLGAPEAPRLATVDESGHVVLTDAGRAALASLQA